MSYCCYRQYDNYFSLALLLLRFFSRVSHFLFLFSCFRCFLHVCLSKSDIETYITTSNDILKIEESLSALFLQKSQSKNSRRKDFQFCQRTLSGLLAQFKKWYFFGDKMGRLPGTYLILMIFENIFLWEFFVLGILEPFSIQHCWIALRARVTVLW